MKYLGKPAGMWALFAGSFEKHLTVEFDLTAEQAKDVAARAKKKYREIIAKLPEFDKRDRFEMNIVNCAMLAAFILCHAAAAGHQNADAAAPQKRRARRSDS